MSNSFYIFEEENLKRLFKWIFDEISSARSLFDHCLSYGPPHYT